MVLWLFVCVYYLNFHLKIIVMNVHRSVDRLTFNWALEYSLVLVSVVFLFYFIYLYMF